MSVAFSVENLGWLQPAPENFRSLLKELVAGDGPIQGARLMQLANHALDLNGLEQLARILAKVLPRLEPGPLSPVRLALLGDATADYLAPAIRSSALRHGVLVELYVPAYGQWTREALDPGSGFAGFAADMALVAPDYRALGLGSVQIDASAAQAAVQAALARIEGVLAGITRAGTRTVLLQSLAVPPDPWCGHLDGQLAGSITGQVVAFNSGLAKLAAEHAAVLFDLAALAALVGSARWFDPGQWHRAKLPFALDLVPLYGDHVARLLGVLRGKARKCLVLDLDNTLWGGVIGDDGLDGIRIGQGDAAGEAHLALQNHALALKMRGIVLAVCSKNEEATARLPFQSHPDMALREADIAVFLANWTDKASNLRQIAAVLNLGTEALVFVDDNPAERARVRQMLPEVAVPELPDDPAYYVSALAQAGYFETLGLSADDANRAEQYRANASRTQSMENLGDYGAYLAALDMACDIRPFDSLGRTRIAQLINKSNQFNLTTRRYSEAEVAAIEGDAAKFTLQIRLSDRFGDNGMISVLIFDRSAPDWTCDSWLMSCRVLGRRVEEAALAAVASEARKAGAVRLIGHYIPSAKNMLVAEHFKKLGFVHDLTDSNGSSRWQLELATYVHPELPMRLTGPYLDGI